MYDYLKEKTIELLGPRSEERLRYLEKRPLPSYNFNDPEGIEWAMHAYYYGWEEFNYYICDIGARIDKAFVDVWDREKRNSLYREYIDWAFSPKSNKDCWQKEVVDVYDIIYMRGEYPTSKFVHDFTPSPPWWKDCPIEQLWGHDPNTLKGLSREEIIEIRPDITALGPWNPPLYPIEPIENIINAILLDLEGNQNEDT